MKWIAAVVAVILLVSCIIGISMANNKKNTNDPEISNPTESATTAAVQETESNATEPAYEVKVVESTPDSITLEVDNGEENDNTTVVVGIEKGAQTSDKGEDGDPSSDVPPATTESEMPDDTNPGSATVQGNESTGPDLSTTFEEYQAMSGEEQLMFYYSFADADAFYEWYNAAKATYESGKSDIIIGDDGTIDAGDIK